MRLSGLHMQQATGGVWLSGRPDYIDGIVTDSRGFEHGQAFLALRGPHFDGHHFAAQLADQAGALIGDAAGVASWLDLGLPVLQVDDTTQALADLAHAWRQQLGDTTVVAISGSYGKTTVRSMLEHVLCELGQRVAATQANLNNLIGVPQTLFRVDQSDDIALIECGISEAGEMQRLGAMVEADVAVLTGINCGHAEGLGGLAGVVQEKVVLLSTLQADGWCALGAGVADLMQEQGLVLPASAMVIEQQPLQWQLQGCMLTLQYDHEITHIKLALPARHWAANMQLVAVMVMRLLPGIGLAAIGEALAGWQPVAGRMQICTGRDGAMVLDDSYNANPASMQAAINTLVAMDGRHIAVLGDMAELGADSEAAHVALSLDAVDELVLVGVKMKPLAALYPAARWYPDYQATQAALASCSYGPGSIVLVKASHSIKLDRVVQMLCCEANEEVCDAV